MTVYIVCTPGHEPQAFARKHNATAFARIAHGIVFESTVLGPTGAQVLIDLETDRLADAFTTQLAEGDA